MGEKNNIEKNISVAWQEAVAGRSAKQITSAYVVALEKERDCKHVIYWVDNCSAQNKNWCLLSPLVSLVNSNLVSTEDLTLKFFEPGHTFMGADSVHHGVEQEMRRRPGGVVYDLEDFVSVVKNSNSKKMEVLENKAFRDWVNGHSMAKLKKMPRLSKLKIIQLRCGSSSILVKTSHQAEEFMEVYFLQKKFNACMPSTLRSEDLDVEEVKKKGVFRGFAKSCSPDAIYPELLFWR